jgi:hypothetical protein
MKKLTLLLMIAGLGIVWAQTGEDFYVTGNDEHSTDATATEIITTEPVIIATIVENPDHAIPDNTPEMDLTSSVEGSYSEYSKKISIPLWYRWRDYSFNALVPYFLEKSNSMGDETVSGLGDVSLGVSYGKYLDMYSTYIDANFSVKMPTGEQNVKSDNGSEFDLGSDTWDLSLALSGFYFMDAFTFKSTVLYKMNGEYDYDTQVWDPDLAQYVDATATADIGDLFLFSAGADYRWQYRLTFGLGILYGNHMAGESDGVDQKNSLQFVDLMPSVKYPYSLFEFIAGAKIPVMTSAEDHDPDDAWSNQENRNPSFFFRTNYRIF